MKKEIKAKGKDKSPTVNIMRRGFAHYVPVEQICKFMNIEFECLLKKTPDNLKTLHIDVVQNDGAIKNMEAIHIKNIVIYIDWLKDISNIEVDKIAKFFIGVHKFHLGYEKDLKVMLEESYTV